MKIKTIVLFTFLLANCSKDSSNDGKKNEQKSENPDVPEDTETPQGSSASGCSDVTADFTVDSVQGSAPLKVKFTNTSKGSAKSWSWDFNNDGSENSKEESPENTFENNGSYTVSLTAQGNNCKDIISKKSLVVVGNKYYVASNGSDSNDGSNEKPWKSFSKASSSLKSGDTLVVKSGNYQEKLEIKTSDVHIQAEESQKAILDGSGLDIDTMEGVIEIRSAQNSKVTGFRVENSDYAGILVIDSENILIDGNYTQDTSASGIIAETSKDIVIENNEIVRGSISGKQEHMTISEVVDFQVRYNKIHEVGSSSNTGMTIKGGSKNGQVFGNVVYNLTGQAGIYVDAWDKDTSDIDVYNNIVHNCDVGMLAGAENGGKLTNIRFFNNVLYANKNHGINSGDWGPDSQIIKNLIIENNTIVKNRTCIQFSTKDISKLENVTIRNNICSENEDWTIFIPKAILSDKDQAFTIEYNLLHNYENAGASEVPGDNYISGDPKFTDVSNNDFSIQAGSAAIDAATGENVLFDFDGKARPSGEGIDIGAYEFQK